MATADASEGLDGLSEMLGKLLGAEKLGSAALLFERLSNWMDAWCRDEPMRPDCYLAVEGGIGVGKSDFLERLCAALAVEGIRFELCEEPVDYWRKMPIGDAVPPEPLTVNILDLMYEDVRANGAAFQQIAHMTRLQELETKCCALWDVPAGGRLLCSERSLASNRLFVQLLRGAGHIDHINFVACDLIGRVHSWYEPTLIVYLRTSTEIALTRIKNRGRGEESRVTREYLEKLNALGDAKYGNGTTAGDGSTGDARIIVLDNSKDVSERNALDDAVEMSEILAVIREQLSAATMNASTSLRASVNAKVTMDSIVAEVREHYDAVTSKYIAMLRADSKFAGVWMDKLVAEVREKLDAITANTVAMLRAYANVGVGTTTTTTTTAGDAMIITE
jgi:deoxyadenosine/deoxycytidine kinase